ncbi:MAG: PAS domain S-box protein [Acidobacteriota bacterium]|nr:PAS domain S-box protein [Acidobacteriota bacterium]
MTPVLNGFPLRRYAVAVATIAIAVLLRVALTPLVGSSFPLATMFAAVAFAVWYGGWGPALLTAVFGFLAIDTILIPGTILTRPGFPELANTVLYLVSCASIIVLGETMRSALRRLESGQHDLSTANLALESKVEAQSLLAAIVASSDDAIVSKTLEGRITSWNKGAEQLFGYTATEAIGQSIMLLVPDDHREQELEILERIRRGQRIEQLEVVRVTKSGARRDIAVTISPVHDRHGRVIGASKTARDITARKAAAARLGQSEAAHRLLVDVHDATRGLSDPALVMREIVTRVGLHFSVTRCAFGEIDLESSVIEITRGYTNGVPTVAGRYPIEVFGPLLVGELKVGRTVAITDVFSDPLTATPNAHQTYAQMRIASVVCVPLLRRGRLVAVMVVCDGQPRAWTQPEAELIEQVAERALFAVESARAVARLRENHDVLALAMQAGKMGAWSHDLTLDTMWWSPELATIFGLSPGDQDYRRARLSELVLPEDRERLPAAIEQALAARQDYTVEFRFKHAATGEWRWMEARGKATYGADGRPQMLHGLGIDITDQKRAVEALREADRRKDDFIATLAHELRNPLAPISSGLHILREARHDAAIAAQARAIMERQVAQMVRLVDDLLDVARITTGKVEMRPGSIDLASAINDAVETAMPIITLGGQQLAVTPPAAPIYVNADRTRLAQVFANLLNNSAKYSERGQPIDVSVMREDDWAVVRVRDGGVGIHPEMQPRVFDMFRQADRTGGRSRGGLGLGLFIVKRIVEMHGGSVAVASAGLGQGTEFTVRIPAMAVSEVRLPDDASGVRAKRPTSRRILIADDNADAAESLAVLLALSGHETRLANDGEAALAAAADFRPEVVFLDIGMPGLDGHETARRIRAQPWGQEVVLVALTGWGQAEDRRRSQEAGFNHHLVKPADPAQVSNLLAAIQLPKAAT